MTTELSIESTRRALDAGIAAALPGGRLGDISAAIGDVATAAGYRVNAEFGGHGLGRTMHEDPARLQSRTARARTAATAGHDVGARTVVGTRQRSSGHRCRRLDLALGRRVEHRALRAHHRHHRSRPTHPHCCRGLASACSPPERPLGRQPHAQLIRKTVTGDGQFTNPLGPHSRLQGGVEHARHPVCGVAMQRRVKRYPANGPSPRT